MRFRKKPVVIEAMQFRGHQDVHAILDFAEGCPCSVWASGNGLVVDTLEGQMVASPGDWLIKGIKGELYPCKPDIFDATYEPE